MDVFAGVDWLLLLHVKILLSGNYEIKNSLKVIFSFNLIIQSTNLLTIISLTSRDPIDDIRIIDRH